MLIDLPVLIRFFMLSECMAFAHLLRMSLDIRDSLGAIKSLMRSISCKFFDVGRAAHLGRGLGERGRALDPRRQLISLMLDAVGIIPMKMIFML